MPSAPTRDDASPSQPTSAALCLHCGAGRMLALARCDACRHLPDTAEDRAAHLLAMELDAPSRAALAERIRGGASFEPDPAELQATIEALRAATPLAVGGFALMVGGLPFLVVAAALFVLAWLLLAL